MKRILIFAVVAADLCLALPASNASGGRDLQAIVARVGELNALGATRPVVESVLQREFGLKVVPTTPAVTAQAAAPGGNDVVLETPILTSREVGDEFIMIGRMHWKDCGGRRCWHKDSGTNQAGDHGGADGFGIQINRPIGRVNAYMGLTSSCGDYVQYRQPADDNEFGTGFKEQDGEYPTKKCRSTGYNWDSATIGEEFYFADDKGYCNDGQRYQIQTSFSHTWDTTSLNSISISSTGIGFSWHDTGHHFEAMPFEPLIIRC